ALRLRHRVLPLSLPAADLLDDLRHTDAAGGSAHGADVRSHQRPGLDRLVHGAHHSPHRVGHGHVFAAAVFHDRAEGAGRGRAAGRRQPPAVSLVHFAAAVVSELGGPVRGALRLRLEAVPVAADDDHVPQHAGGGHRHSAAHSLGHPAARVAPGHGRGHHGAAAAGGGHHRHAALLREGAHGQRKLSGSWWQTMKVTAHRGASAYAPENTMAAFEMALEMGADGIELDVQMSRDGHLVVIHDPTLERTTDGSGLVAQYTLAELRRVDAGAWFDERFRGQRIPTLAEVFELVRGKALLNVELKVMPVRYPGIEEA